MALGSPFLLGSIYNICSVFGDKMLKALTVFGWIEKGCGGQCTASALYIV